MYELLRHAVSDFDVHQGQWVLPGTDAVYKYTARRKKWKRNTVELDHGARGHWLGHSDAKYVMIYFHGKQVLTGVNEHVSLTCSGGGYIAPCTPGHMKYQFAIQKYLRKQGVDISILSLAYTLAPQALHPAFIQQGLSALRYLIEKTNRDPSTILIAGDSAGGNLVANLLLHLGHKHPECTEYTLSKKLKGALLISPWIFFDTTSPSFEANRHSDYLTKIALNKASAAFIGPNATHDAYSQPVDAPAEWWTEVADKAVEDLLVWGGGGEVLIDGIKKFAGNVISGFEATTSTIRTVVDEKAQARVGTHQRAKLVVSPEEAHEEMIINYLFYIKKEDDGGRQIKKWLVDVLKEQPQPASEPSAAEVREEVSEKKEGVLDSEKSIERVEKEQDKRELDEEEKKKAAATVALIA